MKAVFEPGYLRSDAWYVSNYTKGSGFPETGVKPRYQQSNQIVFGQTGIQPNCVLRRIRFNSDQT